MLMQTERLYSFLGMAQKAGKIKAGHAAVTIDLKNKRPALLLIAADASDGTTKKFSNQAKKKNIPICVAGKTDRIGKAIGKSKRSVLTISDTNLVKEILQAVGDQN